MLTLTFGKLIDSLSAWDRLANKVIPSKETRYRLIKLGLKIEVERKAFEKLNLELLTQYGEDQHNGSWIIKKECREEFEEQFSKLKDLQITLNAEMFSEKVMESIEMTPADAIALSWMLEFPADEIEVKEGE